MPSKALSGPTNELGVPTSQGKASAGALGNLWAGLVDETEYVADLRWPQSRRVYDQMRTDPQVSALFQGMTLPIRRYKWCVDPNGARAEVVNMVAEDLGLPIKGQDPKPLGRTVNRFNHDDHLNHALLALMYGFNFFEIVGEVVNGKWRLRKLGPRLPFSIQEILIASDGGLDGIRQSGIIEPLPVARLLAYPWQKEGANWYGRSMFRSIYKPWFIKDKLIRVDLVKHERNGMGVPTAKQTAPDASPGDMLKAQEIVNAWRAGAGASAALPYGVDVELKGVSGSLPDTLASIRYCDEQMAESVLMMFMKLGQTQTGSRALGQTFVDFFGLSQQTVALWYAETTSRHLLEKMVDWNWGPDEKAPVLTFEVDEASQYAVADIVALIGAEALTVDDDLEAYLRVRGDLPPDWTPPSQQPEERPGTEPPAAPLDQGAPTVTQIAASAAAPSRSRRSRGKRKEVNAAAGEYRRPLYVHEVDSAVEFGKMNSVWVQARDALMGAWGGIKAKQIDDLVLKIVQAQSDAEIASIQIEPSGQAELLKAMATVFENATSGAVEEARRQGRKNVSTPGYPPTLLPDRADAIATVLSRSITEAAVRKALQLSGAPDIADQVRAYLSGLTGTYLEDQFGGALTVAQNTARAGVIEANNPTKIYASELLDANTCEPCRERDGREYASMEEALRDYPTGGYKDCKGGTRCRGTLIATYDETPGAF